MATNHAERGLCTRGQLTLCRFAVSNIAFADIDLTSRTASFGHREDRRNIGRVDLLPEWYADGLGKTALTQPLPEGC